MNQKEMLIKNIEDLGNDLGLQHPQYFDGYSNAINDVVELVKILNLHFVSNNEALESSSDGVAVGCHTCKHNPHAPFVPEICDECNPETFSKWQATDC